MFGSQLNTFYPFFFFFRHTDREMSPAPRVSCVLCVRSEETEVTGPLLTKEDVTAHQNCLVISNALLFFSKTSFICSNQGSAKFSPKPLEGTCLLPVQRSTGQKRTKRAWLADTMVIKTEERQEDALWFVRSRFDGPTWLTAFTLGCSFRADLTGFF